MDLQPYVDAVRHELNVAAAAGGPDAQALADRLTAPLESSVRLALLEALSEAAEQITRELAPGSVEVRLRGRDPEFSVDAGGRGIARPTGACRTGDVEDDGGTWRVTLRLPEQLRPRVDAAARSEGSVGERVARSRGHRQARRRPDARGDSDKRFSGWVR